MEFSRHKGPSYVCLLEALQRQQYGYWPVFATCAPVGMLNGIGTRHEDPNGRGGSASGLEGVIDLLGRGVVVAKVVEGEAGDEPVVFHRQCGDALNVLRLDLGRVDLDARRWQCNDGLSDCHGTERIVADDNALRKGWNQAEGEFGCLLAPGLISP